MSCASRTEESFLASLEQKLQLIRDRVQGVAEGYTNGMYLWGEGGISKSFTVEETLKRLRKPFKFSNSRLTAKGLFDLLRDYPDVVHVLEDMETLFSDKNAFGVLQSALWGQTNAHGVQERVVDWTIAGMPDEFTFTGGIIIISNCRLNDIPQLRALKTRLVSAHYRPTNEEIAALMLKIAGQGHRHGPYFLPPEECHEVAQEIIGRSQSLKRNLDLRLFVNGCKDRLQWANGASVTHWRQMLEARMTESVLPAAENCETQAQRSQRELAIARRIASLPPQERLETWTKETGKSRPALYRRLEELKKSSPHPSQPNYRFEIDTGWPPPSTN